MSLTLSLLDDSQVADAYALIGLAANWLRRHGRKQRVANITLQNYRQWQTERANYVVTENQQIVGIVTLLEEQLDEWPEFRSLGAVNMMRALVTHPDHRQKGIGRFAVNEVIKRCADKPSVYLDCVNDFLPAYYSQLGFEVVAQQQRRYPNDDSYDIVLMRKFTSGNPEQTEAV